MRGTMVCRVTMTRMPRKQGTPVFRPRDLAPCAAALLTGSAVIETIFTIPGVGRYFVLGAINRDYTLVMGTVVLVAIFVILFNLVVDILYGLLDPRVRHD